jgi:D-threo-aldose 1-dehydrogenase
MIYRKLGETGLKIPPIIFGTSALGNLYVALDDDTKLNIVSECFKHMPRPVVFDCAGKYGAGLALETLGKLLNELNIEEKDVIISNKLGWTRIPLKTPEPTFEPGIWRDLKYDAIQQISYDGIISCWEQGTKLLGEKYKPKLVSVHDPDEYINQANNDQEKEKLFNHILDAYKALAELKKQGKVKALGVGAKNWNIIEKISEHVDLDWVMFANSLTIMNHPPLLLNFMDKLYHKGVAIINSAVFHAGFLTGGDYYDYKLIKPDTEENKARFKWREIFFSLCHKYEVVPATACIKFAMTPPGVVSIALNTSKPKNVKNNIESVTSEIHPKFWTEMIQKGLISKEYPYLGI